MIDYLFEQIKYRIEEKLPWIKGVYMYEQQDIFQDKSLGYKPPVIFIEFGTPEYNNVGGFMEQGDIDITLKFVFEEYTKNYLKGITRKREIIQALNYWSAWQFALTRRNDDTDENADSLYCYDITFKTSFYEDFTPTDTIPMGGTNGSYVISMDLLLSHDNINYSDRSGSTSGTNFTQLWNML